MSEENLKEKLYNSQEARLRMIELLLEVLLRKSEGGETDATKKRNALGGPWTPPFTHGGLGEDAK